MHAHDGPATEEPGWIGSRWKNRLGTAFAVKVIQSVVGATATELKVRELHADASTLDN